MMIREACCVWRYCKVKTNQAASPQRHRFRHSWSSWHGNFKRYRISAKKCQQREFLWGSRARANILLETAKMENLTSIKSMPLPYNFLSYSIRSLLPCVLDFPKKNHLYHALASWFPKLPQASFPINLSHHACMEGKEREAREESWVAGHAMNCIGIEAFMYPWLLWQLTEGGAN
jgi:hypothetical protein